MLKTLLGIFLRFIVFRAADVFTSITTMNVCAKFIRTARNSPTFIDIRAFSSIIKVVSMRTNAFEGTRKIFALKMTRIVGFTFINIHTFASDTMKTFSTFVDTFVFSFSIFTLLIWRAFMRFSCTLIDVFTNQIVTFVIVVRKSCYFITIKTLITEERPMSVDTRFMDLVAVVKTSDALVLVVTFAIIVFKATFTPAIDFAINFKAFFIFTANIVTIATHSILLYRYEGSGRHLNHIVIFSSKLFFVIKIVFFATF